MSKLADISTVIAATAGLWALAIAWVTYAEGPALFLYDQAQKVRVEVSAREGPRVAFFDAREKCNASLALDEDGPLLALYDANGNVRVGLGVAPEAPFLELYDGQRDWRHSSTFETVIDTTGAGHVTCNTFSLPAFNKRRTNYRSSGARCECFKSSSDSRESPLANN